MSTQSIILDQPFEQAPPVRRPPRSVAPIAVDASIGARVAVFAYGVVSYAIFFATFCYAAGFLTNVLVPKSIDSAPTSPFGVALAVNLALLGIFAIQHSVMARPAFKRWWTRFVPQPAERSTYVLFSSLALIAMFWAWQPMGGIVWNAEPPAVRATLMGVGIAGWALVLVATFAINHFDLFGLRQVWLFLRGKPYERIRFRQPVLYKWVRHPLYLGWFLAFWGTPTMTAAHLVFAIATSAYILIAIQLEERDLIAEHGDAYANYRKRVPMLLPRLPKKGAA